MAFGLVVAVAGAPRARAQAPAFYNHGQPTAEEQSSLERLNVARANPAAEGVRLADYLTRSPEAAGIISQYNLNLRQLQAEFATYPARPPLAFHPALLDLAAARSQEVARTGTASATPNVADRARAAGYPGSVGGENVAPSARSAEQIHAAFLVNWGVPGAPNRLSLLSVTPAPDREAAISLANKPGGGQFPLVGVYEIGRPGPGLTAQAPAQVVGVVYDDRNRNGRYDPGEGISGISVTAEDNAFFTTTNASGGYALPLVQAANGQPFDAEVRLQMQGLPEGTRYLSVTPATQPSPSGDYRANVKWDAVLGDGRDQTPPAPRPTPPLPGDLPDITLNAMQLLVGGPDRAKGVFVFTRVADRLDLTQAVVINYSVGGSGIGGTHYKTLPGSITIPAGSVSAKVKVKPLAELPRREKSVVLTVEPGNGYNVRPSESQAVILVEPGS